MFKFDLSNVKEYFTQVLMDESQRDIYNRFGEDAITFDPRQDELKFLGSVAVVYVYWGVMAYIMTLPLGARASRTWIIIVIIAMLAIEVGLCLTESTLPSWLPEHLTEFELIGYMHGVFPGILACLRCISEYLYIDVDQVSVSVLQGIAENQKVQIFKLNPQHPYFYYTSKMWRFLFVSSFTGSRRFAEPIASLDRHYKFQF